MYTKTSIYLQALVSVTVFLCCQQASVGQRPVWTPEKEQAIEDFIDATFDCHQVVGASFAVVYDGEVRMTRGYGFEDIEQDRQANEDSPFCIGSLTKAFTSTLWGVLIEESEGELSWDTLVKEVMGEDFKLSEEVRTERATLRDLFAHKMGLAYYGTTWLIGLPEGPSRQEYCSRLQFLEPHTGLDFRQQYTYNNFMYMLSTCMAETVTGQEYEDAVQEKIFDKLNMHNSHFTSAMQDDKERVPTQYVWNHKTETMDRLDPDLLFGSVPPSEGSGGLCSSAVDMAQWMLMQLGEGSLDDTEILDADIWRETHTPQFSTGDGGIHMRPFFPVKKESLTYGLGWEIGDYRGYRRTSHSGLVGAFNSVLSVYPDMRLAIFTNTNGPMSTYDWQEALHMYTADVVLEDEPWLNHTTGCTYPDPWPQEAVSTPQDKLSFAAPKDMEMESPKLAKGSPKDAQWFRDNHERYEGHFGHLLLGNMSVYYNESDDFLWGTSGRIGIGRLVPVGESEELFAMDLWGAMWWVPELTPPPGNYPPIRFSNLVDGKYQEIIGLAYDPATPPLFVRGLHWDDLPDDTNYKPEEEDVVAEPGSQNEQHMDTKNIVVDRDRAAKDSKAPDAKRVQGHKNGNKGPKPDEDTQRKRKHGSESEPKFHPRNVHH